ncbi:34636_t:CDS:2, partial [Gigaspora margarita]
AMINMNVQISRYKDNLKKKNGFDLPYSFEADTPLLWWMTNFTGAKSIGLLAIKIFSITTHSANRSQISRDEENNEYVDELMISNNEGQGIFDFDLIDLVTDLVNDLEDNDTENIGDSLNTDVHMDNNFDEAKI